MATMAEMCILCLGSRLKSRSAQGVTVLWGSSGDIFCWGSRSPQILTEPLVPLSTQPTNTYIIALTRCRKECEGRILDWSKEGKEYGVAWG